MSCLSFKWAMKKSNLGYINCIVNGRKPGTSTSWEGGLIPSPIGVSRGVLRAKGSGPVCVLTKEGTFQREYSHSGLK